MTEEQIKQYLTKSGDSYIRTDNLVENEHGFLSWTVYDDALVALQVYGDGQYWDSFLNELAKQLDLKTIKMGTRRDYRAFEKKFGFKLTGYILEKEVNYG